MQGPWWDAGSLLATDRTILASLKQRDAVSPTLGQETGKFTLPDMLLLGIQVSVSLLSWDLLPVGSVWVLG